MSINKTQVQEVIDNFPGLTIDKTITSSKVISGTLRLNHTYNEVRIVDEYEIQITIPLNYPEALPAVKEVGGKIETTYPHIYPDRSLCLATEGDMKLTLYPDFNLLKWVKEYVVSYFYSYSYYKKYRVFPFGDRSHGAKGILEFYVEYFKVKNIAEARKFLEIISKGRYRGHYWCPCGSGRRIRNCHKDKLFNLINSAPIKFFKEDLDIIYYEEKMR